MAGRVRKLFNLMDDYAGKKVHDELDCTKVGLLLKDCERVRGASTNIHAEVDEKFVRLEKELRWLYSKMLKKNILVVAR